MLDSQEVQASFFVVGEWAQRCPDSVKALHQAGHEIMNHSATHPHLSQCSREEIIHQVEEGNDMISALTGETPTLFRCPYGEYNDEIITTVRSQGMTPVQWDVDSLDWQGLSAGEITERVVSRTKSGSILLFHNGAAHTPEALPNVITMLKNQGFRFVKLSELLLDGDYLLDSAGVQHPVEPEADGSASTPSEAADGSESASVPAPQREL